MLVADQKDFGAGRHAAEKVLPLRQSTTELAGPVNGGVDFSGQFPLRFGKCRDNVMHRNPLSHDHDVYVARAGFPARRDGTIDERQLHLARQTREPAPHHLRDAEGLSDEASQFFEDRAGAVRLEIGLAAFYGANQDASRHETLELPLDGAGAEAQGADDLPLIEVPVRVPEQEAQHRLPHGTEQSRSDRFDGGPGSCTHIGYNCTRYGCDSQSAWDYSVIRIRLRPQMVLAASRSPAGPRQWVSRLSQPG